MPAVIAGEGTETPGTVDVDATLPVLGGTPVEAPGCAPEDNGMGTAACLVVSKASSGSFTIQGIAFYPPTDKAGTTTPSGLVTLATEPANTTIGNPGCTATNQEVAATNGTTGAAVGGAVVCAITINGQLFGVGFEPNLIAAGTNGSSGLTSLSLSGFPGPFAGTPSCIAGQPNSANTAFLPSRCAVRQGNTLVGFTLAFTSNGAVPAQNGQAAKLPVPGTPPFSVSAGSALSLGSMSFAGDPSCAMPPNGQAGTATTLIASCGIVSGTTLFGISFDPIDAIPNSSPSSNKTPFQSLGAAPDTGSWTGSIGCASFPDPRAGGTNQNFISCAAISSTDNVFEVTFDPRGPATLGVAGPFGSNANANLSCLRLNIDQDRIYCGGTTTAGAAGGYLIPVGILPVGTASVLAQFLSN
jgi:hypothetical protein